MYMYMYMHIQQVYGIINGTALDYTIYAWIFVNHYPGPPLPVSYSLNTCKHVA